MSSPLVLLRPVSTDHVTQKFGENEACALTRFGGAPIRPYRIINKANGVCPPGSRDFYKLMGLNGHNGRDNGTWHLEPVYHCALFSGWMQTAHDKDGGLNVMVVSNDAFMPCTEGCPAGTMHHVLMIYAHGGKAIGYEKLPVKPGQNVMLADNTGDSSGDHCHWAPKWCDANGVQLHTNNGFSGAFWKDEYFQNVFILDYLKAHAIFAASVPPAAPLTTVDQMRKALFQAQIWLSFLKK